MLNYKRDDNSNKDFQSDRHFSQRSFRSKFQMLNVSDQLTKITERPLAFRQYIQTSIQ